MDEIRIGKVQSTHGVRGELKVLPLTDDPRRYEQLKQVRLVLANKEETFALERVRYHKEHALLTLAGINDMAAAKEWQNAYLCINKEERMSLPEGSYYIDDLIGLTVRTDGDIIGKVTDVLQPGANDVYVIRNSDGKEWYLPALRSTVHRISLEDGIMDITIPDGLLD